jgi:hypothetical protein
MSKFRIFVWENSGVISLELALYSSVLIFTIWFLAELAGNVRFFNDMDRATSTMAEILVNQKLPDDVNENDESPHLKGLIKSQVSGDQNFALNVFSDMLGLTPENSQSQNVLTGLRSTYIDTAVTDSDGNFEIDENIFGIECPSEKKPNIVDFINKLKVNGTIPNTILIMVESCVQYKSKKLNNIIFPSSFYSYFITSRNS